MSRAVRNVQELGGCGVLGAWGESGSFPGGGVREGDRLAGRIRRGLWFSAVTEHNF